MSPWMSLSRRASRIRSAAMSPLVTCSIRAATGWGRELAGRAAVAAARAAGTVTESRRSEYLSSAMGLIPLGPRGRVDRLYGKSAWARGGARRQRGERRSPPRWRPADMGEPVINTGESLLPGENGARTPGGTPVPSGERGSVGLHGRQGRGGRPPRPCLYIERTRSERGRNRYLPLAAAASFFCCVSRLMETFTSSLRTNPPLSRAAFQLMP